MVLIGHGIDVLEIATARRLLGETGSDFRTRCYTDLELRAADSSPEVIQYLAGRFAVKEAVAKALGTGFDGQVGPKQIECRANKLGQPTVVLYGHAEAVAVLKCVREWYVSLSHSEHYVVASAIATGHPR